MRISDWSSDVCSSDLPLILLQVISTWVFYDRHYDTITKCLAQGLAGDVAAVIALLEPEPQLQERREVFQMARSAMQLQLSLTPDAELPAVKLPRVRTPVEIRLADALNERVPYPFTIDRKSTRLNSSH